MTTTLVAPKETSLQRQLSTFDLVLYGLVAMVPVSIWGLFGIVYRAAEGMVALVYLVGMLVMAATASSYALMARTTGNAGSVFSYASTALGVKVGAVAGWLMLLDYVLLPTLLCVFGAESMHKLLPGTPRQLWAFIFALIPLAVSLAGIKTLKWVDLVIVTAQFLGIAFFICAGSWLVLQDPAALAPAFFQPASFSPALIAGALSLAVLSFLGFDAITTLAEETKTTGEPAAARPGKQLGRAMALALLITGGLLALQGLLATVLVEPLLVDGVLPKSEAGTALFSVVGLVFGSSAMQIFLLINIVAVGLGNAIAAQAAAARLLFAMGRDKRVALVPRWFSGLSKRQVPYRAALVIGVLTMVLAVGFAGKLEIISSLVNVGALVGYCLVHLSVLVFWGLQGRKISLRTVVLPPVGIAVLGYVLFHMERAAVVVALIWLLLGVVGSFLPRKN